MFPSFFATSKSCSRTSRRTIPALKASLPRALFGQSFDFRLQFGNTPRQLVDSLPLRIGELAVLERLGVRVHAGYDASRHAHDRGMFGHGPHHHAARAD